MEFKRSHRVGEAILKELSVIFINGLKDPRIGYVTLTAVDVTADLGIAKVYYTVIGDEETRARTAQGIEKAKTFIRRQLAQKLSLRQVPELIFKYDKSIDYGNHIDTLLKDIADEQNDDQSDS